MNDFKSTRYDYFLIWGNGLKHKDNIIEEIRREKSFEIIKIIEHEAKNIKRFVKKIYSYDYAPYYHLKGKTKYLLSTPPKVLFIFVKNRNIREEYFSEGEYRHVESKTVKELKEKIRNKYNERKNDRRTENHVVHASDNEEQTDYILKYLGHNAGVNIFEPYSNIIYSCQKNNSGLYLIKKIDITNLYATINTGNPKNPKIITTIDNTPHYKYIKGEKEYYENYTKKFQGVLLQDDHNKERFDKLIKTLNYIDDKHPTSYIIIKKLEDKKYLIIDGLHRVAILKHKGYSHVISAIIE